MYTISGLLLTLAPQRTCADITPHMPINTYCGQNTTTSAAHISAFKTLLALFVVANTSLFHNASVGPMHGLYLCRGDVAQPACKACVAAASAGLLSSCPRSAEASIWLDACIVRYYSNNESSVHVGGAGFNATVSTDNGFNTSSFDVGCYRRRVNLAVATALSTTAMEAAYGGGTMKFATKTIRYEDTLSVRVAAQCSPDLVYKECYSCLVKCLGMLPQCCNKDDARAMFLSCDLGYEIHRLYGWHRPAPTPAFRASGLKYPMHPDFQIMRLQDYVEMKKRRPTRRILQRVGVGVGMLILIMLLSSVWWCIHKKRAIDKDISDIIAVESLHMEFNMIRAATQNFAFDKKLGHGGFGEVYKGTLENGQDIAVKRLSRNSSQGTTEFKAEVVLVAKPQHRNLVKLLGFYISGKEKILVYEFLSNSSLDKILFDPSKRISLNWETRFKIISGIAKGLLYLHEDSRLKIVHRDLKASNILLDEAMNPKISDFGLAKLFGVDQTQDATNTIVGTFGYMAPEYKFTGHYSVKSDVYSFGVMILEIVTGQRNYMDRPHYGEALLHRVWRLWSESATLNLVDEALENTYARDEVIKCIHIGLLCIQENAIKRPNMTNVVASLGGQDVDFPLPLPPSFFVTNNSTRIVNISACETSDISELYPR